MSERDDWRFGPEIRHSEQLAHDRFRSHRSAPFVRPEDREDHYRQIEEATGFPALRGVAYTALLAAGAYIGLKHFPSKHVQMATRSMRDKVEKFLRRKGRGYWADRIRNQYGKGTLAEARAGIARPGGILDPDLAQDVTTAQRIFSAREGYVGNQEAALSALLEQYAGRHPFQAPMPTTYPQQISDLVNLPGFRHTASRMGINAQVAAGQLARAATHPPPFSIGRAIKEIAGGIRFPFTEWKPFELLLPTELIGRGPTLGLLAPETLASVRGGARMTTGRGRVTTGAMFAGGMLFPIERLKLGRTFFNLITGVPEEGGMRLGLRRSGMGAGAVARMGLTTARPLSAILEEAPELGLPLGPGQGILDVFKMPGMTFWNKLQRAALEMGERFGIGPQYAGPRGQPLGGRIGQLARMFRAKAVAERIKYIDAEQQVLGRTPEGELLWRTAGLFGLAKAGPVKSHKDLGWMERTLLWMGHEPTRLTRRIERGRIIHERQAVAKFLDAAGQELHKRPPVSRMSALRGDYYAFKSGRQGLSDWVNYQLNRPMWLLNEMTGLGLRPGKGPLESMWRIGTRVALPAYFGWQMMQYAEYKSRKQFGYGPISGPLKLYTEGRVASQSVLDAAGITRKAQEIEEQFPGAIDSPFAKAAGLLLGPIGGASLGKMTGMRRGGSIGLATGLAVGLYNAAGATTPADELREMYEGEREVPVRADRWWVLGRQPFSGSRIKYYKKHWFAEMMSDYRDVALYGRRKEAWRGSYLPVPENWFLLKNIADPYYLENIHHYDRPYPVTTPLFEDVPLVGPALSATVGRLIKPSRRRDIRPPGAEGLDYDVLRGQGDAAVLGMGQIDFERPVPPTKITMAQLTGETIHRLFDWTGMPGFMAGAIKEQITGRPGWFEQATLLAASGDIASSERAFYEKNIGGLLGGTELLRRFIPRRRRYATYNPIENIAPEWLPGSSSVFPGDRRGYIDFHQGDPYTLLEKGEARLPGPGYEELYGLHSGKAGVYDEFDRFKVLADVAPFSDAFKSYKQAVQRKIEGGQYDRMTTKQYYRALDNLQRREESRVSPYGLRYQSGAFAEDMMTVAQVLSPTTFTAAEMPGVTFKLAGVKDRVPDMDATQLDAYGRLGSRLSALMGQQVHMTWGGAGVQTPAIVEGLNEAAIGAGLEEDRLSGLGYQAKYGQGGIKGTWEAVSHLQLPAFMDYPRVKWLGVRSPVEEYEQFQAYGTANTGWSKPFENYILPWWHSTVGTHPAQVQRARQITDYVDHVKYLRNRRMAMMARSQGEHLMATQYNREAGQTMVGLRAGTQNFFRDIYAALPPAERPYFNAFAGTTSEQEQERIIKAVPDYMRPIYMGMWKRKTPDATFDSPLLRSYEQAARNAIQSPDVATAEFFADQGMPAKDWLGWHPGVDVDAIRVRMADRAAVDIHQLGLWEDQAIRSREQYPYLEPIRLRTGLDWERRDLIEEHASRMGYENPSTDVTIDDEERIRIKIKKKRSWLYRNFFDPFAASAHAGGLW